MEEKEYFDQFESKMQIELLKLCTSKGVLEGTLLSSEDIDERWKEYAPHYMADSVSQINQYPAAAMAWAGYVGMAVAHRWDEDWATYATEPYEKLHGKEGFDAFSHYKSIVDKKTWLDLPMRYQPYRSRLYEWLLHVFLR